MTATYGTKNFKPLCLGSSWNLSLVFEELVHSSSFVHLLVLVLMV